MTRHGPKAAGFSGVRSLVNPTTQKRKHPNRRARESDEVMEKRMTLLKGLGTGLCVIVLCLLVAPNVKADQWDRKTVVTFSEPVEIPGIGVNVLPAGTYVFKVMDAATDRHTVQIYNQDETRLITTVLAIPNYRIKPTEKTVITFSERPAGEPQALKAWFYPGRECGDQFVYGRARAIILAKETNETILSTPAPLETATPEVLATAPVEAVTPAGETVATAVVVEPPPPAQVAVVEPPVAVAPAAPLPKTASQLPLIGLLGLFSLGGGFVLLSFLRRIA
ncbi:MAG: hypothetical protein ABSF16_09680 [Terracidiphilus sp.]|jgi:hypothetical protein